jgi:nucleotide-binding universal stress UspA family protein
MADMQTILVPTDFSSCSEAALTLATSLAKQLGGTVRLLHVFQLPFYVGWEDGPAAMAATSEFLGELKERAKEKLDAAVAECKAAGVEATAEQVEGAPHARVVDLSKDVDLIVMGTHGRTGLPRLVLGSVAERVVRMAECPVITVPDPAGEEG